MWKTGDEISGFESVTQGKHGTLVQNPEQFALVRGGRAVGVWPRDLAGRQAASVAPHLGAEKANETYERQIAAHVGRETPRRAAA